jgi:hypothetical protein
MGAKHPSCGNPYYEYYQQLIKNNMEKKCTCGDTETQHYENMDECGVCECRVFEEKYEMPQFEGTYEALEKILPTKIAQNIAEAIVNGKQKSV